MKNIMVSIIMMWVKVRILEYFFLVFLLYFLCFVIVKEEMIGEWLKEKIIIGIVSYSVIYRLLLVDVVELKDRVFSVVLFYCGIRYKVSSISVVMNGNIRIFIVLMIICLLKCMMVIMLIIRIRERIVCGGGLIVNWWVRKFFMVLVIVML